MPVSPTGFDQTPIHPITAETATSTQMIRCGVAKRDADRSLGRQRVEGEVEREDVDDGLAEDGPLPVVRVPRDEILHDALRDTACTRHSRDLVAGRRRADVRIAPAAGCRAEIDRQG